MLERDLLSAAYPAGRTRSISHRINLRKTGHHDAHYRRYPPRPYSPLAGEAAGLLSLVISIAQIAGGRMYMLARYKPSML